jgi:hypothetical protein
MRRNIPGAYSTAHAQFVSYACAGLKVTTQAAVTEWFRGVREREAKS